MPTIKLKNRIIPHFYEDEAWSQSQLVCGIDEVGRGCLAGPVVSAAAILQPQAHHKFLRDSKLLTPKQRLEVYSWLKTHSVFSVSFINHRIIDTINIYQATLRAMQRAALQLLANPENCTQLKYILVDAMPLALETIDIPVICFNFGEELSASIAAASIIAKVTRDMLMQRTALVFPGYSFESHKGYATKKHKEALENLGKTIIHRKSFLAHEQ